VTEGTEPETCPSGLKKKKGRNHGGGDLLRGEKLEKDLKRRKWVVGFKKQRGSKQKVVENNKQGGKSREPGLGRQGRKERQKKERLRRKKRSP